MYTQCYHRLYYRNDYAPLLRRLHNHEVGPEHIRTKVYPYLVSHRVYAVTGRNKLIALYLSSLMCAKAVTGYYFISEMHTNCRFIVYGIHCLYTVHVGY